MTPRAMQPGKRAIIAWDSRARPWARLWLELAMRAACDAVASEFDETGEYRDEDDAGDDDREVLLHDGMSSEEVAGVDADADPQKAAGEVVGEEPAISHGADAGDERSE